MTVTFILIVFAFGVLVGTRLTVMSQGIARNYRRIRDSRKITEADVRQSLVAAQETLVDSYRTIYEADRIDSDRRKLKGKETCHCAKIDRPHVHVSRTGAA